MCFRSCKKRTRLFSWRILYKLIKVRRSAYKEGTAKRLLDSDVHAPAKIRANIVAANMDEFQDFFKITENDKMYIKPSKRVKIW
ncbi:hypothetical protein NWE59_03095 [Mycoplasmopsis felis]|uniref:M13-type metalloendopeptidase n=1 Tax=Mycoplasmopsis felis TaxID=33923 RepID=UPI0021B055E4|nr:M13-type metalloendopeptidase [Mycoplasmopsis felis]UWV79002.1 hypothetical protein NWE59_03095 [Mycoplasmopsis felis]